MTPLGEAIYAVLAKRVGLKNPFITYDKLVKSLPSLEAPYDDLTRNDERLFRALGEVGQACRDHGLPTLTCFVIRSKEQSPGSGYFHQFHSEVGNDPARQQEAWQQEVERAKAAKYPRALGGGSSSAPHETLDVQDKSRLLGLLRIAESTHAPTIVLSGQITCSHCSKSIDIEVHRNPKAVAPKHPIFVINETGKTATAKSLGHLFPGTILTSPVLYYGSINHCGHEQWITVFFNRALRDRSDHHLTIMQSTSGQPGESSVGDKPFSLT